MDQSLPKNERLNNKKEIEALFSVGKSFSAYPLRLVYLLNKQELGSEDKDQKLTPSAKVLCTASKRHFKRAVDRNLIKRRIKEAYRLNKSIIIPYVPKGYSLLIAVIYTADKKVPYVELETKLNRALVRLQEKLNK